MVTKEQALEAIQNVALYLPDDGSEDDHIAQDCIRGLTQYIEQSQLVPEGFQLRQERGAVVIVAPDGSGAWYDEDQVKDRIVRELAGALLVSEPGGES